MSCICRVSVKLSSGVWAEPGAGPGGHTSLNSMMSSVRVDSVRGPVRKECTVDSRQFSSVFCTCTHTHTHIQTHIQTHRQTAGSSAASSAPVHTHIHTYRHTYRHTDRQQAVQQRLLHLYTHTYTHTDTHTDTPTDSRQFSSAFCTCERRPGRASNECIIQCHPPSSSSKILSVPAPLIRQHLCLSSPKKKNVGRNHLTIQLV